VRLLFKKLVVVSIISVNIGYTFFLFPILGSLYPGKVPLTLYNFLLFLLVDTIWGVVLASFIYSIIHLASVSLTKAIILSITLLWIVFWIISIILTKKPANISTEDIIIICIDGAAALISGIILSKLSIFI
jgi:hypothetical protein